MLRPYKARVKNGKTLSMLTCYDFQTAQMLAETDVDLILVGDSLGNVVLGYDSTIEVTLDDMIVFSRAVVRGSGEKFVITDMPFGSYANLDLALKNGIRLFQSTRTNALKLEGASASTLLAIRALNETGIPVMGHIGLTPQSVEQLGGHFIHGKSEADRKRLLSEAFDLQEAGVFALVLECVQTDLAREITEHLNIPTIGIGSGYETDGQVLVINDLFKMGRDRPPKFCTPIADLYSLKKDLIKHYLQEQNQNSGKKIITDAYQDIGQTLC